MAPGRLGDEAGVAPLKRGRLAAGFARLVVGLRYVPFAAGVLLVSRGSDYNVFVVGRRHAGRISGRRSPWRLRAPRRRSASPGIALAFSFAMLGVIPLDGFRELAFMMAAEARIETFLVRSLLIAALV
jgi:RND superfamily putative drug exporter